MVLERLVSLLLVGGELLPQLEELNYLGVLLISEGQMEVEIGRHIDAAGAGMGSVY